MTVFDLTPKTPKKKKKLDSPSLLEILTIAGTGLYYTFLLVLQSSVLIACWKYILGG